MWAGLILFLLLAMDEGWDELAARGAWTELIERAGARLAQAPEDTEAGLWLGRASLERARQLLAGESLSRDLGRALLGRASRTLAELAGSAGPQAEEARSWWLLARFESARCGAARREDVVAELERGWTEHRLPYAAFLRGLLATEGPETDAAAWLERAARAAPERGDYALAWSRALLAADERDAGLHAWRAARDGQAPLDALLDMLAELLPGAAQAQARLDELHGLAATSSWDGDARLAWHRAFALEQLGRTRLAAEAFGQARSGRDAAFDRAWARALVRLDRHDEALALLEPWARRRDWDAYADMITVADALAEARRWDAARAAYERALALEGRDERARRNHALTLSRAGAGPTAQAAWDEVIALFPGRADILNDAALTDWGLGDTDRAIQRLEQAVTLPSSGDGRENLALLWMADRSREADALLRELLELEPERDRALYLRFRVRSGR